MAQDRVLIIQQHLFSDPAAGVFVLLDGASIPDLLAKLSEHDPEFACLFPGELKPDIAECAPYLVRLDSASPFTTWVLDQGWGQNWGVFLTAPVGLKPLRNHFRSLLTIKDPDDREYIFRYHDPRVLRDHLATRTPAELPRFFGPASAFYVESDTANLLYFRLADGVLLTDAVPLPAPAAA